MADILLPLTVQRTLKDLGIMHSPVSWNIHKQFGCISVQLCWEKSRPNTMEDSCMPQGQGHRQHVTDMCNSTVTVSVHTQTTPTKKRKPPSAIRRDKHRLTVYLENKYNRLGVQTDTTPSGSMQTVTTPIGNVNNQVADNISLLVSPSVIETNTSDQLPLADTPSTNASVTGSEPEVPSPQVQPSLESVSDQTKSPRSSPGETDAQNSHIPKIHSDTIFPIVHYRPQKEYVISDNGMHIFYSYSAPSETSEYARTCNIAHYISENSLGIELLNATSSSDNSDSQIDKIR